MGKNLKVVAVDTTRSYVEELLRTMPEKKKVLESTLQRLSEELAEITSAAVLRGKAFDTVRTSGSQDPHERMESVLTRIQKDRSECWRNIDAAVEQLKEIVRIETLISEMGERTEGRVLRGLYLEGSTWDSMQEELGCARPTIAHYRRKGIDHIITKQYTRIRTIKLVL